MCELLLLLLNGDRVVQQVHVAPLQTEQLADSKPNKASDEDENAVAVADALGDVPNLLGGRDRTLGRLLDARAFHNARIAQDQLVGDGGRENGSQESITLRGGIRAEATAFCESGVPLAHRLRRELRQLDRTELRIDVRSQLVRIELASAGTQVRLVREPVVAVLLDGRAPGAGIDPECAEQVGLDRVRETFGVTSGAQCLRAHGPRRRPISHLVPHSIARLALGHTRHGCSSSEDAPAAQGSA